MADFTPCNSQPKISSAELLPLVYDELRRLAAARLLHEHPGQTLQPTALVHEAYLRLVGSPSGADWDNPGHFFAAAAEAMRRILVDYARARHADKRGGERKKVEFDPELPETADHQLLALDAALRELQQHDPTAVRLVELRYFAGVSHQAAAAELNLSRGAADRLWAVTKSWLRTQMAE